MDRLRMYLTNVTVILKNTVHQYNPTSLLSLWIMLHCGPLYTLKAPIRIQHKPSALSADVVYGWPLIPTETFKHMLIEKAVTQEPTTCMQ